MICAICGEDYPNDEINSYGICLDCQSSMLADDDINIGFGS